MSSPLMQLNDMPYDKFKGTPDQKSKQTELDFLYADTLDEVIYQLAKVRDE